MVNFKSLILLLWNDCQMQLLRIAHVCVWGKWCDLEFKGTFLPVNRFLSGEKFVEPHVNLSVKSANKRTLYTIHKHNNYLGHNYWVNFSFFDPVYANSNCKNYIEFHNKNTALWQYYNKCGSQDETIFTRYLWSLDAQMKFKYRSVFNMSI